MIVSLSTQGKPRYVLTVDGEERLRTLNLSELTDCISEEYPEDLVCHVQNVKKIVIEGVDQDTQEKFDRLLTAAFTRENSFYAESLREEW